MAVLALKQWFSLKFMQCASIISSESFWKIYLHRWINLEFPWSSLKVVRTSTREGCVPAFDWRVLILDVMFLSESSTGRKSFLSEKKLHLQITRYKILQWRNWKGNKLIKKMEKKIWYLFGEATKNHRTNCSRNKHQKNRFLPKISILMINNKCKVVFWKKFPKWSYS